MIEAIVVEASANGLRTQSVKALLREGQAVKAVEVVRPLGEDAAAFVAANTAALWATATAADITMWLAARERAHRAYYYAVIRAVEGVRAAGGTLDMALAAALTAVDQVSAKRAEFDQWRAMTQLDAGNIQTTQDKRDLLMAVLAFANAGLVGGARLG